MAGTARVSALAGDLGFGFSQSSLERAIALSSDVIAVQGTSADPGPYYLGQGESFYPLGGVRRDLEAILPRVLDAGIPLVASAGGAGGRDQLALVIKIVREIAARQGLHFKLAVIYADIDQEWLNTRIRRRERMPRLGDWPKLRFYSEGYESFHPRRRLQISLPQGRPDPGVDWPSSLPWNPEYLRILDPDLPVAVVTTILALEFELAPEFVTSAVFVSTLASPLTLTPLIAYLS